MTILDEVVMPRDQEMIIDHECHDVKHHVHVMIIRIAVTIRLGGERRRGHVMNADEPLVVNLLGERRPGPVMTQDRQYVATPRDRVILLVDPEDLLLRHPSLRISLVPLPMHQHRQHLLQAYLWQLNPCHKRTCHLIQVRDRQQCQSRNPV